MSNSADMMMRCPACNTGFFDAIAYQVHQANCRAAMSCPSCVEKDAEIEKLQDDIQHWISSIRTDMDKLGLYSKQQGFFIGRLLHLQHILRGEVDDE